ncbi:MAG TPA: protein kinase [Blastocatellia bacterium]|nr:protein kinase [Blastocatellia bacterium]
MRTVNLTLNWRSSHPSVFLAPITPTSNYFIVTPQTVTHYRILSKLGAGGMGEVYLAEDMNLGRRVALKLLPAKFTQDPERVRRFKQEATSVSRLNHPNILTVYEIGQTETEIGEVHFIATEFVEGMTLRQRIVRGRMRLDEALDVAVQAVSALVAAHGESIAHRDIKPENVMLRPDGYVKVLDFGLAKLTENSFFRSYDPTVTQAETQAGGLSDPFATIPGVGGAANTSPGVILGTVSYMSPEQARGQKVDVRTDIFSFGIVLYEMIAGRAPFEGKSTGDMLVAILDRDPLPLARFVPNIPDELEWIVTKALAKEREDRYQSSKSLLNDLKRLQKRMQLGGEFERADDSPFQTAAFDSLPPMPSASNSAEDSGGVLTDSGRMRSGSQRLSRGGRVLDSLAVLPFSNAGSGQDMVYLSEAIPESLIFNLSRLPQLRVKAWSTVARYRNRDTDAWEIGRELDASAVLSARLYQIGDNLVVKAELVDISDGSQLWGAQYQRKLDDLFSIEQELAQEICEHLKLKLNEEQRERLTRRYTDNAEAYQHYLKGRYYWHQRSGPGLKKAIEHFNAAIKLDEEYALALAGLADCFVLLGVYGAAPPRIIMPKAREAAEKALQIDEYLADPHASLGAYHCWYTWNWIEAEREFRRAIELNPSYTNGYHWYGSIFLLARNRFQEAIEIESKALELEPMTMVIRASFTWINYQARRFEDAVANGFEGVEIDPNFALGRFYLGISLAKLHRYDEAIEQLKIAADLSTGGALVRSALANVYAVAGYREAAEEILADLQSFPTNKDVSPFFLALIYAGLGDVERALQMLEATVEERYCWASYLKSEPIFDELRKEKRYADLLEKMGLAD